MRPKELPTMLCLTPLLLLTFIISGCASLNTEFDCPLPKGVQCQRVSDVNRWLDAKPPARVSSSSSVTPLAIPDSLPSGLNMSDTGKSLTIWLVPQHSTSACTGKEAPQTTAIKPATFQTQACVC